MTSRFQVACHWAGKYLHLRLGRARIPRLGPQEGELVGIVLNLLLHAHAGGVAAPQAVVQQDGPAAGCVGLHQRRHFAGVQWVYSSCHSSR